MITKGTMRNPKKFLGILLGLLAMCTIYPLDVVTNLLGNYPAIETVILGFAAYLLFISGRRQ